MRYQEAWETALDFHDSNDGIDALDEQLRKMVCAFRFGGSIWRV